MGVSVFCLICPTSQATYPAEGPVSAREDRIFNLGGDLARQIFGEAIEAIIGERLGLYILLGYWKGQFLVYLKGLAPVPMWIQGSQCC
jgi:hypothetical protein